MPSNNSAKFQYRGSDVTGMQYIHHAHMQQP